jgi:two-component system, cell cycle response regulator
VTISDQCEEKDMSATAVKHAATTGNPPRILVVTNDELLQHKLTRLSASKHYNLSFKKPAGRPSTELSRLPDAEVVLLDISASLQGLLQSLASLKERHPQTEVVLLVPQSEMYFWIEAIHAGAWECLPKPVEEAELEAVLAKSLSA